MNHQIYGVILFAFILILIYLLNRMKSKEGFVTPSGSLLDNFDIYDNVYFDNDKQLRNTTMDNALSKCMNNNQCLGITKHKTEDIFYEITNIDVCKTPYQGSDLEKDESTKYITYLKKSVNKDTLSCVSDNIMDTIVSIHSDNLKVWNVRDSKIELSSIARIDANNEFNLTRFKLVKGLYGRNTVSIKLEVRGFPNTYVVNEYPKKTYLMVKEIGDNSSTELKKSASFRIVNSMSKSGFSIKIIGFPDMIISSINLGENKSLLGISLAENEDAKSATFMIKSELSVDYIKNNDMEADNQKDMSEMDDFGLQDKIKKMRTKNLYTLDKQSNILENQTNMINNYNFTQKTDISDISRAFANQSANLALSKYLEEKYDIDNLKNSREQMIDNIPSNKKL